jgi:hypothetical protein
VKYIKYLILFAWVGVISLVLTLMHSWHYIDLSPTSDAPVKLSNYLPKVENYGIVHFLTPKCSCSQEIYKHLLERGPLEYKSSKETIVVVDDNELDFTGNLGKKGFKTFNLNPEKMKKDFSESIQGVPLLVIYNKNFATQYVGGYSDQSITPFTKINIKNYLVAMEQGRTIASNPIIGCATSKEYQNILDPFGLKYQEI